MAQAMTQKKTSRRQPTRLPSSSLSRKASAKAKDARKKAKKLSVPFTRTRKLDITFKLVSVKKRKATKKTPHRKSSICLILLGVLGMVFCLSQILNPPVLRANISSAIAVPQTVIAQPTTVKKSMVASNAAQLQIPSISVDASAVIVGKQKDGSMKVPSNAAIVGQYQFAPTPGEVGPAIIVGHVDDIKGPAVFWRLRELQAGQMIIIKRVDGTTANFKVDKIMNYSQNEFPTTEVYGNIDFPGLRLITCGGTFNHLTRHYSDNTVVFASLVL